MMHDVLWTEGLVCFVLAELAHIQGARVMKWIWIAAGAVTWARAFGPLS